jgi:hypothetical protein
MEKSYKCPNPSGTKHNVDTLSKELEQNGEFARFFAARVTDAIGGDQDAKDCVDSYYKPDDTEMRDLGIPESKWSIMRKCTESSLLLVIKAKRDFFPK